MANILSKPSVTAFDGTEYFYVVQAGADKKGTVSVLKNYINALVTGGVSDGDKGDIVVSATGATWTIDSSILSTFGRSLINKLDAAAVRTALGLSTTGTYQAASANLDALADLVSAANTIPYFTGVNTAALTTLTSFARTLLDDADAATMRITLGVGTGTGTVTGISITVPSIFSISGGMITTSGTAAISLSTQNANLFFAGPITGSAAAPTFRAIGYTDLPTGVTTLTDGATISVDASLNDNFRVTLGGNRTLANPTNLRNGQVINFRILQDGTGTRTLAYENKYKFAGGTVPVLSTAVSTKDFMSCQYDSTDDTLFCVLNKAFA